MYKKIIEICIAVLITIPLVDQFIHYYLKIPNSYILFRSMLIITPIVILLLMKHKLKPLNKPLFLYGLFILVNIIYLPLNLRDGVGFVIGISIVYINLLFIYSIKDRISILQILKYSIFIISPLVLFNLYLSFDNSFYSHKHQFFGIYSNANIFGIFLVFSLTLLVLSKDLINRHISLFLLISIFYLIMITISRSTMIASLPLFYLYFYNIKLKYIFLLIISLIILFNKTNIININI
jgi:hypothetical protein